MEQTCHRCSGTLVEAMPYCPHCGAPQLTMNSYAQPLSSAMEAAEINAGVRRRPSPNGQNNGIDWHLAAPAALQVALAGGVLIVLANLVPLTSTVAMLWLVAAALLAVGLYHRKAPKALITAGVGARIGTVVGLFLSSVIVTLSAVSFMLERYVLRHGDDITNAMKAAVNARFAETLQQYKAAGVSDPQQMAALQQTWNYMLTPAGMATTVLFGVAMLTVLLVAYCVVTGAIGGRLMLRRQNPV
jgi:hypothetical protein